MGLIPGSDNGWWFVLHYRCMPGTVVWAYPAAYHKEKAPERREKNVS